MYRYCVAVDEDPSDIDGIFRRLAEVSSELATMADDGSLERRMLEAERTALRRRGKALAGGKDSHRSLHDLRSELAAHRTRLSDLQEQTIRKSGRYASLGDIGGSRSMAGSSIEAVNDAILKAGDADEIRDRVAEIREELRRRGEVVD